MISLSFSKSRKSNNFVVGSNDKDEKMGENHQKRMGVPRSCAREREIAIKGEKDRERDRAINQIDHRELRDRNKRGKTQYSLI